MFFPDLNICYVALEKKIPTTAVQGIVHVQLIQGLQLHQLMKAAGTRMLTV